MRKRTGISLTPKSLKKIDEVVKKLNIGSRSEMLEFLIDRYLPNPEDEKALEELAIEIAKWKLSQSKDKKKTSPIILPDVDNTG